MGDVVSVVESKEATIEILVSALLGFFKGSKNSLLKQMLHCRLLLIINPSDENRTAEILGSHSGFLAAPNLKYYLLMLRLLESETDLFFQKRQIPYFTRF